MFLLYITLGMLTWTLVEYLLHRFLGHEHKGNNFFKHEHVQHHAKANYFAPAYKKAIAATIVASSMLLIFQLFLSWYFSICFVLGFLGMYISYEYTHYRYHYAPPVSAPFILLRKHHFYHHFHNPKMNHGVTTRLWDRVFGTFVRVELVHVPKQMNLKWLMIGEELNPRYSRHFRIGKR